MSATIIEVAGKKWAASVRPVDADPGRKSRLYVDVPEELTAAFTVDHPEPAQFGIRGVNKALDREWDQHNAAIVAGWRQVATQVLAAWDVPFKAKFSKRAGCGCSCSPGFVLEDDRGRDIFLTVIPA